VLYDHILTLDYEIELFWKAPWTLVKALFLMNRWSVPAFLLVAAYDLAGLSGDLGNKFCQRWFILTLYFMQFSIYTLIYLLQLRVFALFKQNPHVRRIFMTLYYVSWAASFAVLTASTVKLLPMLEFSPDLRTCTMHAKPSIVRFIWLASFVLELASFMAFGIKAAIQMRDLESSSALLQRLCKDGIRYCITLLAIRILNVVVWLAAPPTLLPFSLFIFWAATAICVNHVLLDIREVVMPSADLNTTRPATDSGMVLMETSTIGGGSHTVAQQTSRRGSKLSHQAAQKALRSLRSMSTLSPSLPEWDVKGDTWTVDSERGEVMEPGHAV